MIVVVAGAAGVVVLMRRRRRIGAAGSVESAAARREMELRLVAGWPAPPSAVPDDSTCTLCFRPVAPDAPAYDCGAGVEHVACHQFHHDAELAVRGAER